MSKVGGGGRLTSPLKASCNNFFFEVSRLNTDFPTISQLGLLRRRASARNVSYTPYHKGENIPYQPLLIKPVFSLLAHAGKTGSFLKKNP